MKNYKYYILTLLLFLGIGVFISCEELELTPETDVTEKDFFKKVSDLQLYTNGFYEHLKTPYDDRGSDDISLNTGSHVMNLMLIGSISQNTINDTEGWDKKKWKELRSINYFLNNINENLEGDIAEINHYVGIGRFFRAYFYFQLVKKYSDVPWYDKPLSEEDEDLYKTIDSRATVVDNMMADLDFATSHISSDMGASKTTMNKYAALAFKARVALYEGTFRKYHSEIGLSDSQRFFDIAIAACNEIIESGKFSLANDYGLMFNSEKLTNNPEMLMIKECDLSLGVANNTHSVLAWQWALSRSLMETYLMTDGTPFTSQTNYDKKTYLEIFKNRDPRLAETIVYPGFKQGETSEAHIPSALYGCYEQLKFFPKDENLRLGWNMNYTSLPIFRYGEVLLIYAEALAEKGSITQDDLNKTINRLRDRVNMPHLDLSPVKDSHLAAQYPKVSSALLLEIRRERRVELACEGFRLDDIKRWGVGELLAKDPQGMYVDALGAYDMTGDGKPDMAILDHPDDLSPISHLSADEQSKLAKYYLKTEDGADQGFYLSEGKKGFIQFVTDRKNPRKFISPQYYYQPIPLRQIQLNPQLKQPYGW